MNQTVRLESKSGELIDTIQLPGEGNEPDAISRGGRLFIRRPQLQNEPPKKNSPETYFEGTIWESKGADPSLEKAGFDKVTETRPRDQKLPVQDEGLHPGDEEQE